MRYLLLIFSLLSACAAPQERLCSAVQQQADWGLVVGSVAVIGGTVAAVDPMAVRDTPQARDRRRVIEGVAMGTVLFAGLAVVHAAAGDAQECIKNSAPSEQKESNQ